MTSTGRERVVPRYDPRGVLCVAFLWGVLLGVSVEWMFNAIERVVPGGWTNTTPIVMLHIVVLWYACMPLVLARVTGRMRLVIGGAIATNLGMFLGSFVLFLAREVGFGANPAVDRFNWQQLLALTITTGIAVFIALGVRWLYRLFRFTPVEEREGVELCRACAYELAGADPCPECGTRRADARPRGVRLDAVWSFVQRAGRPALLVVLIGVAVYAGFRFMADFVPARAFVRRFDTGNNAAHAYVDSDRIWIHVPFPNSIGFTIDLGDGTGRMLLVSYNPMVSPDLPVMQVRICADATLPAGWPAGAERMTDWGNPTIVADLDRAQAERVLRDGLPQGLIEAIVAKADELGWKPWGGMQSGGGRYEIDPGPFFTPKAPENGE